jgi:hypothetical protein
MQREQAKQLVKAALLTLAEDKYDFSVLTKKTDVIFKQALDKVSRALSRVAKHDNLDGPFTDNSDKDYRSLDRNDVPSYSAKFNVDSPDISNLIDLEHIAEKVLDTELEQKLAKEDWYWIVDYKKHGYPSASELIVTMYFGG